MWYLPLFLLLKASSILANVLQIGIKNTFNGTERTNSQTRIKNTLKLTSAVQILFISFSFILLFVIFKYRHKLVKFFR